MSYGDLVTKILKHVGYNFEGQALTQNEKKNRRGGIMVNVVHNFDREIFKKFPKENKMSMEQHESPQQEALMSLE